MSLTGSFSDSSSGVASTLPVPVKRRKKRRKREAPFAIRLSKDERARLESEAAGAPLGTYIKAKALGTYIKAKALGTTPPFRTRRTGLAIEDRQTLAQALALLGRSRLANNLNQLARLANAGALPMTPETEHELFAALRDVRAIRRLLLTALGLKPEAAP